MSFQSQSRPLLYLPVLVALLVITPGWNYGLSSLGSKVTCGKKCCCGLSKICQCGMGSGEEGGTPLTQCACVKPLDVPVPLPPAAPAKLRTVRVVAPLLLPVAADETPRAEFRQEAHPASLELDGAATLCVLHCAWLA